MSNLILMLRPKQWTKNLIIFAGVAFSQRIGMVNDVMRSLGAFAIFCLLSGAVYVVNDLFDREADRKHPTKRHRPIASGAVTGATAVASAIIVTVVGIVGAVFLSQVFAICAVAYLVLMLAYSMWLKHVVIIDLFCIAAGFVLRAVAGAVVIDVEISSWLLVCTILLSLFLGLSKRRHELVILDAQATEHRKILNEYSPTMLDQMISVVTSSTVVAYALYTLSPETVTKFNTHGLSLTIPFVLYGIFRYLYLVHRHDLGGSPEKLLVEDRPLLIAVAAWAFSAGIVIYYLGPRGFL